MSYTKKPWNLYGGELYADDVVIATLNSSGPCQPHDPSEYEANAHLIAAAPDLYEALKFMLMIHDQTCQGEDCQWTGIDMARTALAKAEGHDPQQREP